MTELPEGWVEKRLDTLGDVVTGSTPLTVRSDYWNGHVPFFTPGDLAQGRTVHATKRTVTELGAETGRPLPQGSVMVTCIGNIGRVSLAGVSGITNQQINSIVPAPSVDARYLMYGLCSPGCQAQMQSLASATTVSIINKAKFSSVLVPMVPLQQQVQIVAAIDEQFSCLDVGVAAMERAHRNLLRITDAVLNAAVEGRLSDQATPVVATPEGIPTTVGLHPLPPGWRWEKIDDVAQVQGGIQKQPKRRPGQNAQPYLRVANVLRGRLDLSEVQMMELFSGELEKFRLRQGDLLVVEGNGSRDQIGRSALWGDEIPDCVHQNHIIRVRPGPTILPSYLDIFWNSPGAAERLQQIASTTSGLYTLNTQKVKNTLIAVPPLDEQTRIAAEVERRISLVESLEHASTNVQSRSEALRRSILRSAFRGDLVAHKQFYQAR